MAFQLDTGVYDKRKSIMDYMRQDQQDNLAQRTGESALQANDIKIHQAKAENAVKYLSMATPENWQAVRQAAIQEGLGDENVIPAEYDKSWIDKSLSAWTQTKNSIPSAVQTYDFYDKLPDDKKAIFDRSQRGASSQYLNAGDKFINPNTGESVNKGISPDQSPILKGQQQDEKNKSDLNYGPQQKRLESREGEVGSAEGKALGNQAKKEAQAPDILALIDKAEKLLPNATSGGLENSGKAIANYFGESTGASAVDKQLKVIGAALTSTVPRMEGPQSDFDLKQYQEAAGDVANPDIPYEDRIAAIKIIRDLNQKYATTGNLTSRKNLKSPITSNIDDEEQVEMPQKPQVRIWGQN